jgi:hypothetical protein
MSRLVLTLEPSSIMMVCKASAKGGGGGTLCSTDFYLFLFLLYLRLVCFEVVLFLPDALPLLLVLPLRCCYFSLYLDGVRMRVFIVDFILLDRDIWAELEYIRDPDW